MCNIQQFHTTPCFHHKYPPCISFSACLRVVNYLNSCCLKILYFTIIAEPYFCREWSSRLLLLKHFKGVIQLPSGVIVSVESSIVSRFVISLKALGLHLWWLLRFFSLIFIFNSDPRLYLNVVFLIFILLEIWKPSWSESLGT